jgi:hypothetical protein
MNASGRGGSSLSFILTGISDSPSREAIACHLRVVEIFQAAYDMMISGDDRA